MPVLFVQLKDKELNWRLNALWMDGGNRINTYVNTRMWLYDGMEFSYIFTDHYFF